MSDDENTRVMADLRVGDTLGPTLILAITPTGDGRLAFDVLGAGGGRQRWVYPEQMPVRSADPDDRH